MVKIAFAAASALALAAAAAPAIAQAPDTLSQGELQWRTMFPGVEFAPAYGDWEKRRTASSSVSRPARRCRCTHIRALTTAS